VTSTAERFAVLSGAVDEGLDSWVELDMVKPWLSKGWIADTFIIFSKTINKGKLISDTDQRRPLVYIG
jgi:hypothetical protein